MNIVHTPCGTCIMKRLQLVHDQHCFVITVWVHNAIIIIIVCSENKGRNVTSYRFSDHPLIAQILQNNHSETNGSCIFSDDTLLDYGCLC